MKRITLVLLILLSACALSAAPAYDLQAEIDAAPNGGTVKIPCGVYDIGDVIIESTAVWQKVVTIEGCGHANLGMADVQGGYQWTDPYFTNYGVFGTVLRGTITVRRGTYPDGTTPKVYFRDFSLVGYDGTGTGIKIGGDGYMYPHGSFDGVSIANFGTCLDIKQAYYYDVDDMVLAGCGTGLKIRNSNVLSFSNLNITTSTTCLDVTGDSQTYAGGSIQNCTNGALFGAFSSSLTGFHFENNTASLKISGRGNFIYGNYYASNAGTMEITSTGINNNIFMPEFIGPLYINGGYYNRVWLPSYGVCQITGYPTLNKCELMP